MAKDPYKILGVKKNATDDQIRKAYRSLAKKYHPDVNSGDKAASEKFKEVSAANTLLSDKKLRAQYDSGKVDASGNQQNPFAGGGGGYGPAQGMGGGDMSDLFSSLFGMQMGGQRPGQQYGRGQPRPQPQKGADIRYHLDITLAEAVAGVSKQVRMGNGKALKISIPKGTDDESVLRLRGKGSAGINGGPAGDAKVTIKVKPHKYLRREGNNLKLDLPISLQEAVLGGKVEVPTPTGKLSLSIPAGSSSGKTLRLKGKGVKSGDLHVRLMIVLPKTLPKDLQKAVKSLKDTDDPRSVIQY